MTARSTKTIRTAAFTSLIALMALPFLTPSTVLSDDDDGMDDITKNKQKIEAFKEQAIREKEIPTSEILDRLGEEWIEKYDGLEHFETSERAVKGFINRNLEDGPWNSENALNHLRIQNFETMTKSVGSGHEVALLVAQFQKLQDGYIASEPVKKYHDWLAVKYMVPDTTEGVIERLIEILGDEKFVELATKQAESFNDLADNGSVPNELIQTDVAYWIFVANAANCELDPACDTDALKNGQTELAREQLDRLGRTHNPEHTSPSIWDHVLPEAHAVSEVHVSYDLYAYLSVTGCYYNNCIEDWSDSNNYGSAAIDVMNYGEPPEHAYRYAWMYFYGSACDDYPGAEDVVNKVEVTPYLANELRTEYTEDGANINSCATAYKYLQATADWILGIKVDSYGSYYLVN